MKSNRKVIIGAMAAVVLVGVTAVVGLVAMREPEAPAYVTAEVKLGDVEEAFHKMERGEVLRSDVVL